MKISVGCDPEVFVKDVKGNIISAHEFTPGTKEHPFKLKHGAVQLDGVAMEFNIDPAHSAEEFDHNIHHVMDEIKQFLPKGATLVATPHVIFKEDYFKSLPDGVKELGCTPDYNAYTRQAFPRPDASTLMRTGSGHIHIGWTEGMDKQDPDHVNDCVHVTRMCDAIIHPMSKLWDQDEMRSKLYGKPGCYRPCSYGVEYRTLSNAWLNYPEIWKWLFGRVQAVCDLLEKGIVVPDSYNPMHSSGIFNQRMRSEIPKVHRSYIGGYTCGLNHTPDLNYASVVPPLSGFKSYA